MVIANLVGGGGVRGGGGGAIGPATLPWVVRLSSYKVCSISPYNDYGGNGTSCLPCVCGSLT